MEYPRKFQRQVVNRTQWAGRTWRFLLRDSTSQQPNPNKFGNLKLICYVCLFSVSRLGRFRSEHLKPFGRIAGSINVRQQICTIWCKSVCTHSGANRTKRICHIVLLYGVPVPKRECVSKCFRPFPSVIAGSTGWGYHDYSAEMMVQRAFLQKPPRGYPNKGNASFSRGLHTRSSPGPLVCLGPKQLGRAKLKHKGKLKGECFPEPVQQQAGPGQLQGRAVTATFYPLHRFRLRGIE